MKTSTMDVQTTSDQIIDELPVRPTTRLWSWTCRSSAAIHFLVGLMLLLSAGLKVYQLAYEPDDGRGFLNARWLLVGVVQWEFVLAVLLLSGLWPRQVHLVAAICLGLFSLVAAYKWLTGEATCGCFGKMHVKPIYTTLFDITLTALLIRFRSVPQIVEIRRISKLRFSVAAAALLALSGTSLTAIARYRPRTLVDEQDSWPRDSLVVLEPEQWIGKTFPLLNHIDVGEQLRSGHWKIVLYHSDCSACQAAIPKFEAMARTGSESATKVRVALIEMPPYAPPGASLVTPDTACLVGHLDTDKEWFAQTPVVLELELGKVVFESSAAE
jgi:hypothetical protein